MRIFPLLTAALAAAALPTMVSAKSAVREGFGPGMLTGKRIMLLAPSVSVGSQSAGGTITPNADWTDMARRNIGTALDVMQAHLGNQVTKAPEPFGDDARRVEEYSSLFAAVADSVIEYQFVKGNRLPTKKKDDKNGVFNWSLGDGVSVLPGAKDADYALIIFDNDAYGSTGRKILQVVALLGPGIAITSGNHRGYAGLIDLHTGDVVWMNADQQMGGDVRDPVGATKRVREILTNFPGAQKDG